MRDGVYCANADADFGYQGFYGDAVTVEDGATLKLASLKADHIRNRCILLYGDGAEGQGGALVCTGYGQNNFGQFYIKANTTFMTELAGDYALIFQKGTFSGNATTITLNGNDLTLKAKGKGSRYGYRIAEGFRVNGSGRFIVDGTYLGQGDKNVVNYTAAANDGYVTLVLRDGATFRPRQQATVSFFDKVDAEAGTTVSAGENSSAPFDMALDAISGAPAVSSVLSLSIINVISTYLLYNAAFYTQKR